MPCSAPTALAASRRLRQQLRRLLAAPAPAEGCALLLGQRLESRRCWRLIRLWPCLNVWPRPSERCGRFAIDPREQLLAQRWGRQRGLLVLGHAHSHPRSAPEPSATDRSLCVTPALMLIQGPGGEQRIWWLAGEATPPRPLPWTMED